MPNMVKPVTHETPEKKPKIITTNMARTKFCSSDRTINKKPALVKAAPKRRLLENCENTFGPRAIPEAKPVKTAPNSTPYAASPPARSPTNVRAKPITAPAATNAPSKPTINPRTIFEDETNFPPSNNEPKIEFETSDFVKCSLGISS